MERIKYIDSIRGLAILLVIFIHVSLICELNGLGGLILSFGAYGVQLFFLVSGYTIFQSLQSTHGITAKDLRSFFIKRFLRIFPLYWVGILGYSIVYGMGSHWLLDGPELWHFPTHFFLLNSLIPGGTSSVVPGGWSISVEVIFYLLSPLLILFSRSLFNSAFLFLTLAIVGPLLTGLFSEYIDLGLQDEGSQARFWYRFFLNHVPIFCLGFVLYHLLNNVIFVSALISKAGALAASLVFVFALFQAYYLFLPIPRHISMALLFSTMWLVVFIFKDFWQFNNGFLRFWGRVSYSAYLAHFYVVRTTYGLIDNMAGWELFFVVLALSLLGSAMVARILFSLVELPLISLAKSLANNDRRVAA